MGVVLSAVAWARQIAADSSHGYDQNQRWGPDYDCSSLVISAYKQAGLPLQSTYTGNMFGDFIENGFKDVSKSIDFSTGAGLEAGDVLLNKQHHTAMSIGEGRIVQASINENGTVTGGKSGDQTGGEIAERSYYRYSYGWDCVLRYVEDASEHDDLTAEELEAMHQIPDACTGALVSARIPTCSQGCTGAAVIALQAALKYAGYDPRWVDGDFGTRTHNMLMAFQVEHGLEADGICGQKTWETILLL